MCAGTWKRAASCWACLCSFSSFFQVHIDSKHLWSLFCIPSIVLIQIWSCGLTTPISRSLGLGHQYLRSDRVFSWLVFTGWQALSGTCSVSYFILASSVHNPGAAHLQMGSGDGCCGLPSNRLLNGGADSQDHTPRDHTHQHSTHSEGSPV